MDYRVGKSNQGFTLIELMVAVAVLAVIVGLALPTYTDLAERNRLRSASEALYSELQLARTEALKTKVPHYVIFEPGAAGAWCVGIIREASSGAVTTCDCSGTGAGTCDRAVIAGDYPNISMPSTSPEFTFPSLPTTTVNGTVFEERRGTTLHNGVVAGGTVTVESANYGKSLVVSSTGRVRVVDGHYSVN